MIVSMHSDPEVNLEIFVDAILRIEDDLDETITCYKWRENTPHLAIHADSHIRKLYNAWKTATDGRDKMLESIHIQKEATE